MDLSRHRPLDPYSTVPSVASLRVTSTDFPAEGPLPVRHAYYGAAAQAENLSPQLSWTGLPPETRSLAVTCFDPDTLMPGGWWHWLLIDLPAELTELATAAGASDAALPPGARHTVNDFGNYAWDGPYPPAGDHQHRYYIAVHALDVERVEVADGATPNAVSLAIALHTVARGVVLGSFVL